MTEEKFGMDFSFTGKYQLINWLCFRKFTWLLEVTIAQVERKKIELVHWLLGRIFKNSYSKAYFKEE